YSMLPEYIKNHIYLEKNKKSIEEKDLLLETLKIIKNNEESGFGSGRTTILKRMNEKKLNVTEAIVRKTLYELNRIGYIKSNRGRGGSVLTSLGEKFILDKR
ncbi:hypothetical protein, partial [Cetobacterium sp.]|uniref:hypothetical protein n=1 Tax=Cetobacterium sp. TaxID=2071632 RepID=UPI003AEF3A9E